MKTFIVVNIKTGELLHFDCPVQCRKCDMPKKPQDLIGYEPPNIEDLKLVVYPGLLTINDARRKGMRYKSSYKAIVPEDGEAVQVTML